MWVICPIPSKWWRQRLHPCSEQNFCQASSVNKTFEHYARPVFVYIACASESRPELTQSNEQWLTNRYSLCKQMCNNTLQKIFALLTQAALLEPLPSISLKPSALGEGALRLQVCVNAVKFAIIANLIALGWVLEAVRTTRALCSFQWRWCLEKDIWAESERTLRAVVDTRPLPFHHSSVSHSVSLCFV